MEAIDCKKVSKKNLVSRSIVSMWTITSNFLLQNTYKLIWIVKPTR